MTSDPIARYQSQRAARLQRTARLRPMTPNEVVDSAMRVYQLKGLALLRATALPSVFCLGAIAFVTNFVLPAIFTTKNANDIRVQAGEVVVRLALALFVGGPVFLTGLTYATTKVVRITSDYIEDRPTDERAADAEALRLLPRLFWLNVRELLIATSGLLVAAGFMLGGSFLTLVTSDTNAIAGIVAAIGLVGLAIGGLMFLYVISRDALVAPIAVIEQLGAKQAGRRSSSLLKTPKSANPIVAKHGDAYGVVWNLYMLIGLISGAILTATIGAFLLLSVHERLAAWLGSSWEATVAIAAVDLVPYYLAVWLVIPIWATTLTLIYYERRIRLEGFDIEAIASHIGGEHSKNRFDV